MSAGPNYVTDRPNAPSLPRYNTKYATVDKCKTACQNEVANCDAINYNPCVFLGEIERITCWFFQLFVRQMRAAVVIDVCIFVCVALIDCISPGNRASVNSSNAMVIRSMAQCEILTLTYCFIIGLSRGTPLAKVICVAQRWINGNQSSNIFRQLWSLKHDWSRARKYSADWLR